MSALYRSNLARRIASFIGMFGTILGIIGAIWGLSIYMYDSWHTEYEYRIQITESKESIIILENQQRLLAEYLLINMEKSDVDDEIKEIFSNSFSLDGVKAKEREQKKTVSPIAIH